jgi:hypothetical protein
VVYVYRDSEISSHDISAFHYEIADGIQAERVSQRFRERARESERESRKSLREYLKYGRIASHERRRKRKGRKLAAE